MTISSSVDAPGSRQIVAHLGRQCEQLRLALDRTQSQLARQAGVSVRTVRRLERDGTVSLDTFVRVLIALGQAENLAALLPDTRIRPAEHSARRPRERQRASGRGANRAEAGWTWGDER